MLNDRSYITLIECDLCKEKFNSNKIKMLKDNYSMNIESLQAFVDFTTTYYACPHCGKKHIIMIDTDETLALQEKMRRQHEHIKAMQEKYVHKKTDILAKRITQQIEYLRNLRKEIEEKQKEIQLLHNNEMLKRHLPQDAKIVDNKNTDKSDNKE